MNTDIYTFSITDSGAPYVDNKVPTDDEGINKHDNITFNIKDDGSNGAVDLAHTIIYVNGVYYTNSGGAGAVTTNGTRITFASSLNFNGGNYSGDTTARTGSPGNYHFVIDPQNDFATGEAVPVIIYTQDLASPTPNIMERVVYVPVVHGATCANGQTYCGTDTVWDAGLGKCTGVSTTAGSAYCGSNTTWNSGLNKCVGSGGGSGGGSCNGGGGSTVLTINPSNVTALQIDETSILMTWYSSQPGTGRVVYGANSPKDYGKAPNYNYSNSTLEKNDSSTYHSVVISGLRPGVVYYLRPVSKINGTEISGNEITMVTKFAQTDCNTCPIKEVTVCPEKPAAPITPAKPSAPIRQTKVKKPLLDLLKILNIKRIGGGIMINGTANPSSKLKLIIY